MILPKDEPLTLGDRVEIREELWAGDSSSGFSSDFLSVVHLVAEFFWKLKVINTLKLAVHIPNQLLRFSLNVAVLFCLSLPNALHWWLKMYLPDIFYTAPFSLSSARNSH